MARVASIITGHQSDFHNDQMQWGLVLGYRIGGSWGWKCGWGLRMGLPRIGIILISSGMIAG